MRWRSGLWTGLTSRYFGVTVLLYDPASSELHLADSKPDIIHLDKLGTTCPLLQNDKLSESRCSFYHFRVWCGVCFFFTPFVACCEFFPTNFRFICPQDILPAGGLWRTPGMLQCFVCRAMASSVVSCK